MILTSESGSLFSVFEFWRGEKLNLYKSCSCVLGVVCLTIVLLNLVFYVFKINSDGRMYIFYWIFNIKISKIIRPSGAK